MSKQASGSSLVPLWIVPYISIVLSNVLTRIPKMIHVLELLVGLVLEEGLNLPKQIKLLKFRAWQIITIL